jgi:hypothetical protein
MISSSTLEDGDETQGDSGRPMFSGSTLDNFIVCEHVSQLITESSQGSVELGMMTTCYSQLMDSASISSVNVLPPR